MSYLIRGESFTLMQNLGLYSCVHNRLYCQTFVMLCNTQDMKIQVCLFFKLA